MRRHRPRHLRNAVLAAKALEELTERIVFVVGIEPSGAGFASDADVDDGAAGFFGEDGEVGQARCRGGRYHGWRRRSGAGVGERRAVELHVARRQRGTDAGGGERVGDF